MLGIIRSFFRGFQPAVIGNFRSSEGLYSLSTDHLGKIHGVVFNQREGFDFPIFTGVSLQIGIKPHERTWQILNSDDLSNPYNFNCYAKMVTFLAQEAMRSNVESLCSVVTTEAGRDFFTGLGFFHIKIGEEKSFFYRPTRIIS